MAMIKKRQNLEKRRKKLVKRFTKYDPWIKGSIAELERICGSKGCTCRHGGPKHPAMYITWKEGKETRSLYIPRKLETEVKQWSMNYRKVKAVMEKITKLQREIISLR